ncbi:MAG: hemerythrin domain-containing protein, partial [Myxococcales bacterium]|nr:hemerythrin domain-containing protein [Myxococcales bacterium]
MDYRIPEFSGDRHQVSRRARAKQHARGFEGIFETLVEEHTEAAMMLDVLCRTTDAKQRAALWPKLRRALLSHDQDEVRILCPDLHELVETRRLAQRHDVEARDLESMIRRLDGRAFDHPEWLASALTLRQLVVRHIREEENELFF